MKKIILLLLAFVSFNAFSQDADKYGPGAVPVKDGVVTFTMVNEVSGQTKDQLFSSAKIMIAEMFNSANDVIQSEDKDSGIIVCKGNAKIKEPAITNLLDFTLKIACKDGRYKVDLYNLKLTIGYGGQAPTKQDCNKTIIDEAAIKDGKVKKMAQGKQRRMVIDEKDNIFSLIKTKMKKVSVEEDW